MILKLKVDLEGNNFVSPRHTCSKYAYFLDKIIFNLLSDLEKNFFKDIKMSVVYITGYASHK